VNKMRFHIEAPAVHGVLGGVMEMELQQAELVAVQHHGAARIGVALNGVAVVDDPQGGRLVIDRDLPWRGRDCLAKINGGLLKAQGTNLVASVQIAPVLRACVAAIGPMGGVMAATLSRLGRAVAGFRLA